jgi:hypothetical protein
MTTFEEELKEDVFLENTKNTPYLRIIKLKKKYCFDKETVKQAIIETQCASYKAPDGTKHLSVVDLKYNLLVRLGLN